MAAIDALLATLGGKTLAQLSAQNQALCIGAFRPQLGGFSPDQLNLMQDWYVVVPPARLGELASLNSGRINLAVPVFLADGTKVLPISLLTDCASSGETFGHLRTFFSSLKFRKVNELDWPISVPES